jgi:hypothetical protein
MKAPRATVGADTEAFGRAVQGALQTFADAMERMRPWFFLTSGALISSRQLWPGQSTAAWDLSVLGDARWTPAGDYRQPALECHPDGHWWCTVAGCGYSLGYWIGEGISVEGARAIAAAFGAVLIVPPRIERALPQPRWWCPVHGELDFDDDAGRFADGTPYCLMPGPEHPDEDCGCTVTRGVEGFVEHARRTDGAGNDFGPVPVLWRGVSARQLRPVRGKAFVIPGFTVGAGVVFEAAFGESIPLGWE